VTAELSNIETAEVSLVTRGANRKRFALRKEETTMADQKKKEQLRKALEDMSPAARKALVDALRTLANAGEDLPPEITQSLLDAAGIDSPEALLALLGTGDAPTDPADSPADVPGGSVDPTAQEMSMATPTKSAAPVTTAKLDPAELEKLQKAEKTAADAQAKNVELQKKLEEGEKARVELEKKITAERDARLNREFIAKAEKLTHLPTKAEELGPILKELHDKAPEAAAKIEKLLEQANEKAGKVEALLKEQGHSRQGKESNALEELNKVAAEIRKSEPKLTEAAAFDRALKLHPELYEKYNQEKAAA
jgi:hypothetical protein